MMPCPWQMHTAGCKVTHLVRSEKLQEYQTNGIEIHCLDLRKRGNQNVIEIYRPEFVDKLSPDNSYDYILVSVNSNQIAGLLPTLKQNCGKATIVILQNLRMGDDELIASILPQDKYLIAYPFKAGGGKNGNRIDNVIFDLPLTNTVLGEVSGEITDRAKKLYQLLKLADMNPKIIKDIIPYVRTHYVWGAVCVAAYIKAGSYDKFMEPEIIRESYLAMREGWEICVRQGINPRAVSPTRLYYLPFPLLIPFTRWIYRQKGMREMFEGHVSHSPEEMKDMVYTLLNLGDKYQVNMPVYKGYLPFVENYFSKVS